MASNYEDEQCCTNLEASCCMNPAVVNQSKRAIDPARLQELENNIREAQRQIERGSLMLELALIERSRRRPYWSWGYR
jgi:hypothetical protein